MSTNILQRLVRCERTEKTMSLYDFGSDYAQTYIETCKGCGADIEVSTQQDRCPEYTTEIYIKCGCGESVEFELPVN